MELHFSKYEGAGNDFILIDMTSSQRHITPQLLQRMCNRKTGIGADGVLVLEESLMPECCFRLQHYNPSDGTEGDLCGNGSRCSLAFAEQVGLISLEEGRSPVLFEASDGVHFGGKLSSGSYFISIKDIAVDHVLQVNDDTYSLNIGNPHHVRFVADVSNLDVGGIGKPLRWTFGANVSFVQVASQESVRDIAVRTYEKGVEEETLACGTGATASAVVTFLRQHYFSHTDRCKDDAPVSVKTCVSMRGGQLEVTFTAGAKAVSGIRLAGPVKHVFDGVLRLEL